MLPEIWPPGTSLSGFAHVSPSTYTYLLSSALCWACGVLSTVLDTFPLNNFIKAQ